MPSDDAKAVNKLDSDDKSLSSIMESCMKKLTNANTKPKAKKEEPKDEDDDFENPVRKSAGSKVKKEQNAIDGDGEDHKPISIRNTTAAATKVDNNVSLL
ncbi:hypothetical protein OWV82_006695 [Melia azedarach]|uniref:Uncharacterized protein n=1 Tax=Melia azedarach TaxID=155640 RepID=A0ACC1YIJ8_MELAZ|nr:hypothetical protein OWV82_006695 [Melia azedarach]